MHSIYAYIQDSCGGSTTTSATTFSVPPGTPLANVISPTSTPYCLTVPLNGTYEKDSCCTVSVMYSVDGGAWSGGANATGAASTGISGYWTSTNITPTVGGHTIRTYVTDTCNGTSISSSITFTFINSFTPSSSIILPAATSYCGTVPLYGSFAYSSCCTNKTVSYSVDAANWIPVTSIALGSPGLWSNNTITPAAGRHTIRSYIIDGCGSNATSSAVTFTLSTGLTPSAYMLTPTVFTPAAGCETGCETAFVGGPWGGAYAKSLVCTDQSTISIPGATEICLSFDANSKIGLGDSLYIYTSGSFGGTQAPGSPFTGNALVSAVLHISSSSARICVDSDGDNKVGAYNVTQACYSTGAVLGYACGGAPLVGTFAFDSTCCSVKTISYNLNNTTWINVSSQGPTGASGYWTQSPNVGSSGGNTIQLRILDACGNSTISTRAFTVDIPTPLISILQPIPDSYCSLIPLNGTFSKASCCTAKTITYKVDADAWAVVTTPGGIGMTGIWSNTTISGSSLAAGQHSIQAYILDQCGGTDVASVYFTMTGLINPTISVVSTIPVNPTNCETTVSMNGNYYWMSGCCTSSCLQYKVDSGNWTTIPTQPTQVCYTFEGSLSGATNVVESGSSAGWQYSSAAGCSAHGGTGVVWHDDFYNDQCSWLVLGAFSPDTSSQLTYWQAIYYLNYTSTWELFVGTDSSPPTGYTKISNVTKPGTSCTWEQNTVSLSAYAGKTVYLAFRYCGNGQDNWFLDDICLSKTAVTYCPASTGSGAWFLDLAISSLTNATHTVNYRITSTCSGTTIVGTASTFFNKLCCAGLQSIGIINPTDSVAMSCTGTSKFYGSYTLCPTCSQTTIQYAVDGTTTFTTLTTYSGGYWTGPNISGTGYAGGTHSIIMKLTNCGTVSSNIRLFSITNAVEIHTEWSTSPNDLDTHFCYGDGSTRVETGFGSSADHVFSNGGRVSWPAGDCIGVPCEEITTIDCLALTAMCSANAGVRTGSFKVHNWSDTASNKAATVTVYCNGASVFTHTYAAWTGSASPNEEIWYVFDMNPCAACASMVTLVDTVSNEPNYTCVDD